MLLLKPNLLILRRIQNFVCDALSYLVPFVQFKEREKHPQRGVTFSKVAGCLSYANSTKSRGASHMLILNCRVELQHFYWEDLARVKRLNFKIVVTYLKRTTLTALLFLLFLSFFFAIKKIFLCYKLLWSAWLKKFYQIFRFFATDFFDRVVL